jgi:hypothetical protein
MYIELADVNLRPANVDEALEALERVAARLGERRDPRSVFPAVYAIITRRVKEAIADTADPLFLEPQWISRLAGRFGERYLETRVDSLSGRPYRSAAWRVAYQAAARGRTVPVQDAVLGINAHINFDLAQGLYDNVVSHGAAHDPRMLERYRHDHDAVNRILEASIPEILQVLVARYGCRTTQAVSALPGGQPWMVAAVMRVLAQWRGRVWEDLLDMLDATSPSAFNAVLRRMDRRSARLARVLCTGLSLRSVPTLPWPPPAGAGALLGTLAYGAAAAPFRLWRLAWVVSRAAIRPALPRVSTGSFPPWVMV